MDPNRLVTAALDTQSSDEGGKVIEDPLGEYVDVIGINNYCGWYVDEPESCADIKWRNSYQED